MEPPKDDKPRFNYGAIAIGGFFAIYGLVAICTGRITAGRRHTHTFSAAQDPHGFWFTVCVTFVLAAICLFYGFAAKK